ncbi:MAG: hypothetical protein LZF86_220041 [Nitrospira sp.]|nr:MAG: hypothetical protein LZF86_220041 [Nitrospira sp.]
MKQMAWGAILLGSLVWLGGCAGKSEEVPMNVGLAPVTTPAAVAPVSSVKVVVIPFQDDRSDRMKLGIRRTRVGADQTLTVKSGTVGEATAKAFADYLIRKGWRAQYVSSASQTGGADVVISGKILELSTDTHGMIGSTDITAKSKMTVQASNQVDGSSITSTNSHTGNYTVFWYAPEDGEELLSEVLERNFEKFMSSTKFDGAALRFR